MVALDFTPAQEEAFKASFRVRRRVLVALAVLVLASILVATFELAGAAEIGESLGLSPWTVTGCMMIVALLAALVTLWAWRCPACRHLLGADPSPSYCQRCGCAFH